MPFTHALSLQDVNKFLFTLLILIVLVSGSWAQGSITPLAGSEIARDAGRLFPGAYFNEYLHNYLQIIY